MSYSVKAHITVDGPFNRVIEFHHVCSHGVLEKVDVGQNSSLPALRIKVLTAMLLEEINRLAESGAVNMLGLGELQFAYGQAFSAQLHALSALGRNPPEEHSHASAAVCAA